MRARGRGGGGRGVEGCEGEICFCFIFLFFQRVAYAVLLPGSVHSSYSFRFVRKARHVFDYPDIYRVRYRKVI